MRTDRSVVFPDQTPAEQGLGVRHFDDGVSQSGSEADDLFLATSHGGFEKTSLVSGLDGRTDGRSLALLDIDRDGWLDVVSVNANSPFLELHRNEMQQLAPTRGFVAIELEGGARAAGRTEGRTEGNADANGGPDTWSNRSGIGARIDVVVGETVIARELRAGEGLAAQNTSRLVVGIGDAAGADAIRVRWPSGRTQSSGSTPSGSLVRFDERGVIDVEAYTRHARPRPRTPSRGDAPALPLDAALTPRGTSPRLHLFTTLATWCDACVQQATELRWASEQLGDDIAIHGVATDSGDREAPLRAWMERHVPPYDLVSAHGAQDRTALLSQISTRVRETLGEAAYPASVVTDATGTIVRIQWGVPTVSALRAAMLPAGADAEDTGAAIPRPAEASTRRAP